MVGCMNSCISSTNEFHRRSTVRVDKKERGKVSILKQRNGKSTRALKKEMLLIRRGRENETVNLRRWTQNGHEMLKIMGSHC